MRLEDLGFIGNCQISALVERSGSIVWSCLPRFDSEPVFASLLDHAHGGSFRIGPASGALGVQRYLDNTNVLETTFEDEDGAFRVLDFAPRFMLHDRVFRPTQLYRIVEPLRGAPMIQVRCEPVLGWSKTPPRAVQGSNHIDFVGYESMLRLTTDLAPTYCSGQPTSLTERRHFALTWGAPVEEALVPLCHRLLDETVRYWQRWVKHSNIPPLYQHAVIRSALALKLHCFDDTGAIVASMTTSIPEAPGSGRTWDYRYCWLRDAYYALGALRLLGHFEEREHFVQYLLNIAASSAPELELAPLYRIDGRSDLDEHILPHWPGFNGEGPVRIGNGAAKHVQHDIYGETVLALAPVFMDERFKAERTPAALELLQRLARKAIRVVGTPDAGIWEYRTEWKPQTFSSLMCWAAADRMANIAALHAPALEPEFRSAAAQIHAEIERHAYNQELSTFVAHYGGRDLDASLLQMAALRFTPARDPKLIKTVHAVRSALTENGWLFRYQVDDGFGQPKVAFVICTFWLIEALAVIGEHDEAAAVMRNVYAALSPLGLLSEDYATVDLRMWGNFPQAYSHVGLIHAAFAASPRWADVL